MQLLVQWSDLAVKENTFSKQTHSRKRTHSRRVQWSDRIVFHLDHRVGAFEEGEAIQVACAEQEVRFSYVCLHHMQNRR